MISVVGISHHSTPLDVREQFAVSADGLPRVLEQLQQRFGAAVVVSTCNRTELYLSKAAAEGQPGELRRALAELSPNGSVPAGLYTFSGKDAARHLLRVSSGLDSMILGEDQILGQVRAAFMAAAAAGTTDR